MLILTKQSHYRIKIQGGLASNDCVYIVEDKTNKRRYKLKIISKKYQFYKATKTAIKLEIKNILQNLRHPNIVPLLWYFEDSKHVYLVFEHFDNSQKKLLKKKRRLTEKEAVIYFKQIVDGLEYLHNNHVLHRNLTPENIFFDKDGILKLDNFGFSKKWENQYKSIFNGKTEYMSAEYLSNKNINENVDIWSLGILLYEMLQGELPFKSINVRTQINQMKSTSFEIFNKVRYSISDEVKVLLRKLLRYNPIDRISIKSIKKHQWIILYRQVIDENFNYIENILSQRFQENMEHVSALSSPQNRLNEISGNDDSFEKNLSLEILDEAYLDCGQECEIQTIFSSNDEFNPTGKKLSKEQLEKRLEFEPPIEDMSCYGISVESQQEQKYQLIKFIDEPTKIPKIKKNSDKSYEIFNIGHNNKNTKETKRSLSNDQSRLNSENITHPTKTQVSELNNETFEEIPSKLNKEISISNFEEHIINTSTKNDENQINTPRFKNDKESCKQKEALDNLNPVNQFDRKAFDEKEEDQQHKPDSKQRLSTLTDINTTSGDCMLKKGFFNKILNFLGCN